MQINRCWNCMEDLGERDRCPNCGFDPEKQENAAFALRPNTILHGKYLVGNVLGQGGYGITYIGLDLALELKVAIKEYYPAGKAMRNNEKGNALYWRKSDSPEESWRNGCIQFLSEARKMARINSIPEIVSVRDTFEENNTAYIVMDYVPGMTMKEYLKKNGLLTFEECVKLLSPVIDGLDKVHRQGLIHRDISPDNLMITPEKKVYLLDLGAAKDMKNKSGGDVSASKAGFSPIEQDTSTGSIGPWTDVYALAASIYYCVYGKLIPSSMKRYEQDTLSFSGKAKKPLTNKQIAVLKKALAIQQEGRYQSVKEMLTALREACESKKKKGGKLVAAIAGIAAVAAAAAMLIVNKPWLPEVVEYGSNGPYFSANFAVVEDKFEYFTDLDNALVRVPYNEEDETFYLDTAEVIYEQNDAHVDDVIGGLNLSEDKLYATYYGGRDSEGVLHEGYLLSMNHDGTDLQQLQAIPYEATSTQYIKLSNGEEYLYYLMDDGSEEGDYHLYLYRFNLQTMTQEQLREEEIEWYGLYKKYLYYSIWDQENKTYLLYRATPDGKGGKLVDDVHGFWNGFVANGKLYLIQLYDEHGEFNLGLSIGLVECGQNGKPIEEGRGIFNVMWDSATYTVGGGWIYYNENGSDELYRIRLDGTGNSKILSGYQYHNLSYHNSRLYFQDGTMEGETFHPYQAYIASSDGSWIAQCGFAMDYLTDEQGVRYVIEDGQAKAVGYVGTEEDVILPLEFNGYPFNDDVKWEEFVSENVPITDLHFYALMEESELTYTKDASGITITGYSGMKTGDISQVAIPTEIDGVPVVKIGKGAFMNCTFNRVYLPKKLVTLGESAFEECNKLVGVVFPETLEEIEDYAFYCCSFEGRDLVLPEGLLKIGHGFVQGCEPSYVYLPATLEEFTNGFLVGCNAEYVVAAESEWLKSDNGIVFSKNGKTLYAFPCDREGKYTVPKGVTRIDEYAFFASDLEAVTLPDGLKEIGGSAFERSKKLKSINIPETVKTLGEEAFYETGLTEVTLPRHVQGVEAAFEEGVAISYYN